MSDSLQNFKKPISAAQIMSDHRSRARSKSSNMSDIYKNPQVYAGFHQSDSLMQWSELRTICFLTPCFSFYFIVAFCVLFSITNVEAAEKSSKLFTLLHFLMGGILSVILTIIFQKLAQKFYGTKMKNFALVSAHFCYLLIGLVIVFSANLSRLKESNVKATGDFKNRTSNSSSWNSAQEHYNFSMTTSIGNWSLTSTQETTIPSVTGFSIVLSSVISGHYLLASIVLSTSGVSDHNKVISVSTLMSALGGCLLCILGIVFYSELNNGEHYVQSMFYLLSIAIGLTLVSYVCCLVAWCGDVVLRRLRLLFCHGPETASESNRNLPKTAQDAFDECAPLLKRPSSSSQHPVWWGMFSSSRRNSNYKDTESALGLTHSSSYSSSKASFPKQYVYTVPTRSTLSLYQKLIKYSRYHRNLAVALLLMFVMVSSGISFEFSSGAYMTSFRGDIKDKNDMEKGAQQACAGLLVMYLSFAGFHFLYKKAIRHLNWKRLSLGLGLMVSVWTLALAITHDIALFYITACVQGMFKVAALSLPQMLTTQAARAPMGFQKNIQHILIENPLTALWCMPAVGLVVYSAILPPIVGLTERTSISMYYSATAAILSCLGLLVFI